METNCQWDFAENKLSDLPKVVIQVQDKTINMIKVS